ncbi:MAG: cytochrome c [Myxococcales bacterium]|nr:cytochrome c [Myxococcales bacterium]
MRGGNHGTLAPFAPLRGRVAVALWLAALTFGCQRAKPWPDGSPQTEDEQLAQDLWTNRCAECHGKLGHGDGPTAHTLKTPPRNFTDPEWQKEEKDDELEAVILLGGAAMGYSSEMPPNPDLNKHPNVAPLLVKKIRSLDRSRPR